MSRDTETNPITRARVVLELPGMAETSVRRDVPYGGGDSAARTLDIRYPSALTAARTPAVVFVTGYADPAFEATLGCKLKDMQSYISWSELMAASGLVAVTYANVAPAEDVYAVLEHLRSHAEPLGIDAERIALWACSGNVPNALGVLMREQAGYLRCAVLGYGFMLDTEGSASVAEGAKTWGFVNPCVGKSIDDLPAALPLFVARAGRDTFPGVNESIDRFVTAALADNRPLTLVNLPEAPHAFDLFYNTETSRDAVESMLAFVRAHLTR